MKQALAIVRTTPSVARRAAAIGVAHPLVRRAADAAALRIGAVDESWLIAPAATPAALEQARDKPGESAPSRDWVISPHAIEPWLSTHRPGSSSLEEPGEALHAAPTRGPPRQEAMDRCNAAGKAGERERRTS